MIIPAVLIIDDEESDRYLIKRMLRRGRICEQIIEARSGADGVAYFEARDRQSTPIDTLIVLLDINMPRMNGLAFLEHFASQQHRRGYQQVICFMLSSSMLPEEKQQAFQHPFVKGFIMKLPPDPQSLQRALHAGLDG